MANRIPPEAFEFYHALGPGRSYETIAAKYGVSKRAVTKRAVAERWQARVIERDQRTQAAVAEKVEESIADLRARHTRVLKVMTAKALEALKLPMTNAMDGIRALDLILKQERLLHGEPTVHAAVEAKPKEVGQPMPEGEGLNAYFKKLLHAANKHGVIDLRDILSNCEDEASAKSGVDKRDLKSPEK